MEKFHPHWEPKILSSEVVAIGTWFYDNKAPYDAKLVKTKSNYTSLDLAELDELLEIPFHDYLDFAVSDEGVSYHWEFSKDGAETTTHSFSTYYEARDHLNTYDSRYEISW